MEPIYFENYDLENIIMPIKVNIFIRKLKKANYNAKEIEYLQDGFQSGYDIGYEGPKIRRSESENIPLKVGSKI